MCSQVAGKLFGNIIPILIVTVLLTACVSENPVEQSTHGKLADCSKIADRGERTRCIDAANR